MPIRLTKSVSRLVETPSRTLVVTLTAEGLIMREKYARKSYLLPYGLAYVKAVGLAVNALEPKRRRRPRKIRRSVLRAI